MEFIDTNGNKVQFSYESDYFVEKAEHVLVICKFENRWLLTNHKIRGWEFPGGKVEKGESLEEAAYREVWEETGASLKNLIVIGSYKVTDHQGFFIKKVYFGVVEKLVGKGGYYETSGPVLVENELLLKNRYNSPYSFIMQDPIIEMCFSKIEKIIEGAIQK
jgi:8-oxo-dGTP diphosphatase